MNNSQQRTPRRSPLSTSQWQSIVNNWRSTGTTASAYCREHGISPSSLWKWNRRFGEHKDAPLMHSTPAQPSAPPRFLSVEIPNRSATTPRQPTSGTVELLLPGGYVVRLHGPVSSSTVSAIVCGVQEAHTC